jgi:hypothetical protein
MGEPHGTIRQAVAPPRRRPPWGVAPCLPRRREPARAGGAPLVARRPHWGGRRSGLSKDLPGLVLPPAPVVPNAGAHLLPEAAARHERRLEAVRCSALLDAQLRNALCALVLDGPNDLR